MRVDLTPDFITKPLAHRGLHTRSAGVIENSTSAIEAAIAAGYGVEIDVQLSSDGIAMVFHDEALGRLTEQSGLVRERTSSALQDIVLRGGTDTIPTLQQILKLVAGRAPLLIEIKDQTGTMGRSDGMLEAATAQALAAYSGPVAVMSFNPHSIAQMAILAPTIARGLTTSEYDYADWAPLAPQICDHLRAIPDYDRAECSFISHEVADLNRARVNELKQQGAKILCWTVKSKTLEMAARKVADNITFERYAADLMV